MRLVPRLRSRAGAADSREEKSADQGDAERLRGVRKRQIAKMLPRFPSLSPQHGDLEIFLRANGWWWWTRAPGSAPKSEAVGPFQTTTEAYSDATMRRLTAND